MKSGLCEGIMTKSEILDEILKDREGWRVVGYFGETLAKEHEYIISHTYKTGICPGDFFLVTPEVCEVVKKEKHWIEISENALRRIVIAASGAAERVRRGLDFEF